MGTKWPTCADVPLKHIKITSYNNPDMITYISTEYIFF